MDSFPDLQIHVKNTDIPSLNHLREIIKPISNMTHKIQNRPAIFLLGLESLFIS